MLWVKSFVNESDVSTHAVSTNAVSTNAANTSDVSKPDANTSDVSKPEVNGMYGNHLFDITIYSITINNID